MATGNSFDILGDDDNDDLSQLIAKREKKIQALKAAGPAAAAAAAGPATSKFPSKPAPPTQAARDAHGNNTSRGGFGRGGSGRGGGRGGSGRPREFRSDNSNGFTDRAPAAGREEGGDANKSSEAQRQPYRGPRRGGYQGGDDARPPRRAYERHSGTGRGNEVPRQGSGRGNWGSFTNEPVSQEHEEAIKDDNKVSEKPTEDSLDAGSKDNKDEAANEAGEKEAEEDKEMTLEEYEKIREENRKALLALKTEERKVEIDKDLQSLQVLSTKKSTEEVFIKLGSGKDAQKKRDAERDERAKKSVSITEFLKPAEGERYYGGGGGRGRGNRGRGRGGYSGGGSRSQSAPAIEDQLQFPTLGGK